ncbi:MAG: energy-coupling factor ABC transporter permease [Lachnospiraceae bacterium]|nr:energy-coupling factor ABC transporter permease [Lachnospiraceae bacterium]
MHMADALVIPAVAGVMYAASASAAGVSIHKVRLENDAKKIPVMGIMGAFVFAAQMINFTIPGTGSSGHLCGGMMLTALLGPYAGFLTMIGVLLIQCLFFADGGLLALGCNVWNMAFYGCFIGALIWKAFMKNGADKKKIIAASVIGSVVTLQLGAFSVTLETLISGITELPFSVFLGVMQPIHLAIGFVEGLITAAVLCFVHEARPELLWGVGVAAKEGEGKLSFKKTLAILGVATLLVGGILSLFASAFPDGLEWSMEKVAGTTELEAAGTVYETAESVQEATAFLPDYAFPESESAIGTTVSGIVGALLVVVLCVGASYLFRFFRNKRAKAAA